MEQNQSGDIFYALQRVANDVHKYVDQMLLERLGIGVSQLRILHVLQEQEMSQRNLADDLGQTEASISRQAKVLMQKGLVQTRVNPKNQRERLVSILPKGARIMLVADTDLQNGMSTQLEQLTDKQRKQLQDILNTLRI